MRHGITQCNLPPGRGDIPVTLTVIQVAVPAAVDDVVVVAAATHT